MRWARALLPPPHRRNGQTPDIAGESEREGEREKAKERDGERERERAGVVIEFRVLPPSLHTHPIYFSRLSVRTLEKLSASPPPLLKGWPHLGIFRKEETL